MSDRADGYSSPFYLNLAILSYCSGMENVLYTGDMIVRKLGILISIPIVLGVMVLIRMPCIFMEISIGQYSNKGALRIWDLCPILRGVGFCGFIVFLLRQATYTVNSTYLLFMTAYSIQPVQYWASCNHTWNTVFCFVYYPKTPYEYNCIHHLDEKRCNKGNWETSFHQFYSYKILNLDRSGAIGAPEYKLTLICLVTCFLIIWCTYDTPRSTEHVLLILTIISTTELVAVLYITLTDKGGLSAFKTFRKSSTLEGDYWNHVIQQLVNSPGLGLGAYVTLGTRSGFRSPVYLKVVVANLLDAIILVVYALTYQNMVAALNYHTGVENKEIMNGRAPFVYTIAPAAFYYMNMNTGLWCFVWFSHSYLIALRTLIVMMSINVFIIEEHFEKLKKHRFRTTTFFCLLIYGLNIICYTRGGVFIMKFVHFTCRTHVQTMILGIELCAVFYIYGLTNYIDDLQFMLGIRTPSYWNFFYALSPILVAVCCILGLVWFYTRKGEVIPNKVFEILQYVTLWFVPVIMAIYALYYWGKNRKNKGFRIWGLSPDWGPRDRDLIRSREMFTAHTMTKEYVYRQERLKMRDWIEESNEQAAVP